MKDNLIDIRELSDSKELLLTNPNPMFLILTIIISMLFIISVIWMHVSKLDVYVKANGLVRTNEPPSELKVINGGRAQSVNISEGQYVYKGELLLSFDQQLLYRQKDMNSHNMETIETEIEMLKLYRKSIEELVNCLEGINTDIGLAYSLKVKSFILERETVLAQASENEKTEELQKNNALIRLKNANDTLTDLLSEQTWLQRYKASIENGQDMLSIEQGDSVLKSNYVSLFQKYKLGMERLENEKGQTKDNLDKITHLYEMGEVSRKELDDAQITVNEANDKIRAYRLSELSDVDSKIAAISVNISEARKDIKSAEQNVSLYSETRISPFLQVEQSRTELLSQINNEIQQKNESIDRLNAENESLDDQIRDSLVTAPIEGILNLNVVINEGDIISPGTDIGFITPPDSDSFKVSLQVSNKDIAGVKLNQPIKFKFLALPYQEYGMVDGFVSKISADSRINGQTGESFYIVEAILENKPIKSYRGADENIRVGMAVEGRLISDQKTILRWLLEKLNFM